jgi:glutamate-ammonia-ligase adenylyltransferase
VGAHLVRRGFRDPDRAKALLADPALGSLLDVAGDMVSDAVVDALGDAPDPDAALLGLVRLMEAVRRLADRDGEVAVGAGPGGMSLAQAIGTGGQVRDRLFAVLGSSTALADHLARHPEHWVVLADEGAPEARELREDLVRAVGGDPASASPVADCTGVEAYDRLRVAYRRRLLALAGRDLSAPDPTAIVPQVGQELADLAAAALEAGLAIGRAELPPGIRPSRLAVIGMGKCGGRELNYVSDVDVIFVVAPGRPDPSGVAADAPSGAVADAEAERAMLASAEAMATSMMRACSAATAEGTLWPVDAGLRPEGKDGPLVRTLASHVAYYERWAKTWEFQALLKARPVAGDLALGRDFVSMVEPMVWRVAERDGFVGDVQAMRRRVLETIPARDAGRQLKLGAGGLRDVEFAVQLLQLVHGRQDLELRSGTTLVALEGHRWHRDEDVVGQ